METKNVTNDVLNILKKYLPEITRPLRSTYPVETSAYYYRELGDYLIGVSIGFLVWSDEKEFLNYAQELIPKDKRKQVSATLKKIMNELKNYKSTLSTEDLNRLRRKKDIYIS